VQEALTPFGSISWQPYSMLEELDNDWLCVDPADTGPSPETYFDSLLERIIRRARCCSWRRLGGLLARERKLTRTSARLQFEPPQAAVRQRIRRRSLRGARCAQTLL
jgi:hypothetical protein